MRRPSVGQSYAWRVHWGMLTMDTSSPSANLCTLILCTEPLDELLESDLAAAAHGAPARLLRRRGVGHRVPHGVRVALRARRGRAVTCTHCTRRRRISRPSRRDLRRPLPCFARHRRKTVFGRRRRMAGEVFSIPGKRGGSRVSLVTIARIVQVRLAC